MATLNQEKVFQRVAEKVRKGGKVSVSAAMRGIYAPSTATKPDKVTRSKGWKDLCKNAGLTDKLLIKKALQGLEAKKIISANITYGDANEKTNDFIEVDDFPTQHKYLETGLAMLGRGTIRDDGKGQTFNFNFLVPNQLKRVARRIQNGDPESTGESDRLPDSDES